MELAAQLEKLIQSILAAEDLELVEVQLKGRPGSQILKVFIDSPAGVTLDKCTEVSRLISERLDMDDPISGRYRLEVSSPGLGRPLRSARDYRRNLNREVEVLIDEEKPTWFHGLLVNVNGETIIVEGKKETKNIPISRIKHGKLSLPW